MRTAADVAAVQANRLRSAQAADVDLDDAAYEPEARTVRRNRTRSESTERATAYHEAGHAVASYFKNVPFKMVTIVPDPAKATLGHVQCEKLPEKLKDRIREGNTTVWDRYFFECHIVVCLAGQCAERRFTRRNGWCGSQTDYKTAVNCADYLHGGDCNAACAYVEYLLLCTKALVENRWWRAIKGLAAELIRQKTIDGRTVRRLIRKLDR